MNIWKWIDWIVSDNLPFTFVQSEKARENSNLEPISFNTLKKYMKALVTIVQRKISVILKEKSSFGLITDGWTVGTEHYLAVFATFICNLVPDVDSIDDILLSCSVQEDVDPDTVFIEDIPDEDKHFGLTADDMFDAIVSVLVSDYDIEIDVDNFSEWIEFLAGDNVSTNRSFCNKTEVPLAGCESHRLQLGVYDKLGPEKKKRGVNIVQEASIENQALSKVDKLMGELNTIKNAAILRGGLTEEEGDIKPERRTRAEWASLFKK